MNIDQKELKEKITNIKSRYDACSSAYENLLMLRNAGRIEKAYIIVDKIVKDMKKSYPDSYCNSCTLTCCINDLFLPVTFIEWKTIENYLNRKVSTDIKNKIKENLEKINMDLFISDIKEAEKVSYKYKNKTCPFLINNQCSIKPYRPISCRTYGLFLKQEIESDVNKLINKQTTTKNIYNHESLIQTCSLELSRWKEEIPDLSKETIYLVSNTYLKENLNYLNYKKSEKLLIVWLKEYFDSNNEN